MRTVMSKAEIEASLKGLDGWKMLHEDGIYKLSRDLSFNNFSEAWSFMSRVALLAEKLNHHPNWSNVYKKVDIVLFSHDVAGVSQIDIQMAERINSLLS